MTEVDITLPRKNFTLKIKESFSQGITGIFGPSGAGKSSLLHSIAGIAHPNSGRIVIEEKVIFDHQQRINTPIEKRHIGYVFQEGRLFPHMSVKENLCYGLKKSSKEEIGYNEVVDLLNLGHILQSKPSRISGGERQRTALGRALLSSPDILLLDEPFSAVDINLRRQILPFILNIQQRIKMPILVVSHDLPDLLKLTNSLLIIQDGRVLAHGEYYKLVQQPQVSHLFARGAIVNAVEMVAAFDTRTSGLTYLRFKNLHTDVMVKCDGSREHYAAGQHVKMFINADDIALSTEPLPQISIQNQLQGYIEEVIDRETTSLCIINVGFTLVVEVTTASIHKLQIAKGSSIWCLFKSVAIDTIG